MFPCWWRLKWSGEEEHFNFKVTAPGLESRVVSSFHRKSVRIKIKPTEQNANKSLPMLFQLNNIISASTSDQYSYYMNSQVSAFFVFASRVFARAGAGCQCGVDFLHMPPLNRVQLQLITLKTKINSLLAQLIWTCFDLTTGPDLIADELQGLWPNGLHSLRL